MTPTNQKLSVIGAGAWGTALAKVLAEKGHAITLWAHERDVVDAIRLNRENSLYLRGVPLPPSIHPTHELEEAVSGTHCMVFVAPSQVARSMFRRLVPYCQHPIPIVSATKGIEEGSCQLMSQVFQEVFPASYHPLFSVLSGPSFALEVARGLPTAVTLMAEDRSMVAGLQQLLMTTLFRVYTGTDLIGVQLGGALKNVMALAAGAIDGLELGHNTRAALITRGLAEMIRLGTAMGADPRTFYGLSGVGDLVLTCTGSLSRNYSVGVKLGKGDDVETILGKMHAVVEGVQTARAALGLAARFHVEMPIVQEVCKVLFERKPCKEAVTHLMERSAKEETHWS